MYYLHTTIRTALMQDMGEGLLMRASGGRLMSVPLMSAGAGPLMSAGAGPLMRLYTKRTGET
jgi:hypothetical protein